MMYIYKVVIIVAWSKVSGPVINLSNVERINEKEGQGVKRFSFP